MPRMPRNFFGLFHHERRHGSLEFYQQILFLKQCCPSECWIDLSFILLTLWLETALTTLLLLLTFISTWRGIHAYNERQLLCYNIFINCDEIVAFMLSIIVAIGIN